MTRADALAPRDAHPPSNMEMTTIQESDEAEHSDVSPELSVESTPENTAREAQTKHLDIEPATQHVESPPETRQRIQDLVQMNAQEAIHSLSGPDLALYIQLRRAQRVSTMKRLQPKTQARTPSCIHRSCKELINMCCSCMLTWCVVAALGIVMYLCYLLNKEVRNRQREL